MTDNLLSTKFIFAILSLGASLALCLAGIVTGQEFLNFIQVIGGIYVIGNVAQKFIPQEN